MKVNGIRLRYVIAVLFVTMILIHLAAIFSATVYGADHPVTKALETVDIIRYLAEYDVRII